MRPNTPREQLLQNLLAMGSVLLFRATKALDPENGLIVEIETWFEESQVAIKLELEQEYAVIPERRAEPRFSPSDSSPWKPPIISDQPGIMVPKPKSYFGV